MKEVDSHGLGSYLVLPDGFKCPAVGGVNEKNHQGNTQGGQAEYRKDIGKARYTLKTVGTVGNGVKHGGCNERPDNFRKAKGCDGKIIAL